MRSGAPHLPEDLNAAAASARDPAPAAPRGRARSRLFSQVLPRLVAPTHAWEVSARGEAGEVDPRSVGLTRDGIASIWASVERLYETRLHPAIALCVRVNGQVVIDRAVGHARGNAPAGTPGASTVVEPVRADTPFTIFSASKAVTAILVHMLDERRLLHLDDPVAEYLPAFAARKKRWITIRHVLTHRAGLPTLPGQEVDLELLASPDRIVSLLADAEPRWRPGQRLAYHALTGGFILGEVVRAVTGRPIERFLREEILDPLGGFPTMGYGAPAALRARVAENAFTGFVPPFPLSKLVQRALGVEFLEACRLSNDPRFLEAVVPAGNIVATASEVSRFFQMLLNEGELDGVRVLESKTVRRAVSEQSYYELDLTLGFPIRHGLGLMLGGNYVSPFGPDTPKAFGHLGFTNVVAWADPERELAASLMTSGKPIVAPGMWRVWDVLRQIGRHCPRR